MLKFHLFHFFLLGWESSSLQQHREKQHQKMLARIVNATARPMARVASTPAPWDIHSLTSLKLSPRGALSFVHGHYSMRRSLATKSLSAMTAPEHERLAKSIARSDLGLSRREAERYIDEGRVVVNGSKVGNTLYRQQSLL